MTDGQSMDDVAREQLKKQEALEAEDENYVDPSKVSEPDGKTKAEQTNDKSVKSDKADESASKKK